MYYVLLIIILFAGCGKSGDNPLPPSSEVLAKGKAGYKTYCLNCHGVEGRGDGPTSRNLLKKPASFLDANLKVRSDQYLYDTIASGVGTMPGFANIIDEKEIWEIIVYLRQLQDK